MCDISKLMEMDFEAMANRYNANRVRMFFEINPPKREYRTEQKMEEFKEFIIECYKEDGVK